MTLLEANQLEARCMHAPLSQLQQQKSAVCLQLSVIRWLCWPNTGYTGVRWSPHEFKQSPFQKLDGQLWLWLSRCFYLFYCFKQSLNSLPLPDYKAGYRVCQTPYLECYTFLTPLWWTNKQIAFIQCLISFDFIYFISFINNYAWRVFCSTTSLWKSKRLSPLLRKDIIYLHSPLLGNLHEWFKLYLSQLCAWTAYK